MPVGTEECKLQRPFLARCRVRRQSETRAFRVSFPGAMETDSTQQIKNSRAAVAQAIHARGGKLAASAGRSNMPFATHQAALQALANGEPVPYPASLRIVVHEGDRAPQGEGKEEKKPPGYSRNTSGGFFTS